RARDLPAARPQVELVRRLLGDEHARAGPRDEVALGDELLVGLDGRRARHAALGRELPRRGHAPAAGNAPIRDRTAEELRDLVLQRDVRVSVERETAPQRMHAGPGHLDPPPYPLPFSCRFRTTMPAAKAGRQPGAAAAGALGYVWPQGGPGG